VNVDQFRRMSTGQGFIAALDQSGGSTPKALRLYGVEEWADEAEMFRLVHEMRTRIMTSPAFTGARVLGAILFDRTMESTVDGLGTAEYLWQTKQVVPFLKIDKGLLDEADGARMMKPMPDLEDTLARARKHGVFGTKMRSVVSLADKAGVQAVVDQQLSIARQVVAGGLVPIVEPEVDIHSPQKAEAEDLLRATLHEGLDQLGADERVLLKLTLPEVDGWWTPLVEHPNVVRVVALSGGYTRSEACARLARQPGVVASFSRALAEGLAARQSEAEFDAALDASIETIYQASLT
jgi:fructose-bisphosphate aldolase class I